MKNNYIVNSENFDKKFKALLVNKNKKSVIKLKFDFESVCVGKKIELIKFLISNKNLVGNIVYKILFWEKDEALENCLAFWNYKKIKSYKNGIKPGIIFVEQDKIDTKFIDFILLRHFNFELAKEPSLNIKVQFFIKFNDQFSMLFDIYDDRGFYAYYL